VSADAGRQPLTVSCPYCGASNEPDCRACGACSRVLNDPDTLARRRQRARVFERLRRVMASSVMASRQADGEIARMIGAEDSARHLRPGEVAALARLFELERGDYSAARRAFIRTVKGMEDAERRSIAILTGEPVDQNSDVRHPNSGRRADGEARRDTDLDELERLVSLRRKLKGESADPKPDPSIPPSDRPKTPDPVEGADWMLNVPPQIGKYQVLKRLRQGGMGILFLGRDPHLERPVAIKVIRADIDSPALRDRFKQEARDLSRLRHPNIVVIHDYGEFAGLPYLAMEFIEGESLADVIARRAPFSFGETLRCVVELCDGMEAVHRAKIVHRDLKPDNVMIDGETGLIKILDFGIARHLETGVSKFTRDVGTPCYMAPEQILSGHVDARTDIWAIGTILYELLSHERAFDGDTYAAVAKRIVESEPPRLKDLNLALDPAAVRVVERALRKDPGQRYQTVADLRHAVAALAGIPRVGRAAQTIPPPASAPDINTKHWAVSRMRVRAIVVLAFLLLALGWLAYSWTG
jgi:serine/threonine protein kinase